MKRDDPYFLEVETNGCKQCSHGRTWMIIGPDGDGLGTSYEDYGDAEELCEILNTAYWAGYDTRKAEEGT